MKCAPSKAVFSFLKLQLHLGVLFAVIIIFFRSVPHLIIVIVVSAVVALRAQLYSTLVSLGLDQTAAAILRIKSRERAKENNR